MTSWTSPCGTATIYLGDCRDVLRELAPPNPDAVEQAGKWLDRPIRDVTEAAEGLAVAAAERQRVPRRLVVSLLGGPFTAVVTDPPYGIEFLGRGWDRDIPGIGYWSAVMSVCVPGAPLLAFGGSRTYHRLAAAVEDSGWSIRDCLTHLDGDDRVDAFLRSLDPEQLAALEEIAGSAGPLLWLRGAGFPKSGAGRFSAMGPDWVGWAGALRPLWEPIVLARAPFDGSETASAGKHGVAGLHVDACRLPSGRWPPNVAATHAPGCVPSGIRVVGTGDRVLNSETAREAVSTRSHGARDPNRTDSVCSYGRETVETWDCAPGCPITGIDAASGDVESGQTPVGAGTLSSGYSGSWSPRTNPHTVYSDRGGASRFYYTGRSSATERGKDNDHPTVKPLALVEWLCRMVRVPGRNLVLDPFLGSGTTVVACIRLGIPVVGIEMDERYWRIAVERAEAALDARHSLLEAP